MLRPTHCLKYVTEHSGLTEWKRKCGTFLVAEHRSCDSRWNSKGTSLIEFMELNCFVSVSGTDLLESSPNSLKFARRAKCCRFSLD